MKQHYVKTLLVSSIGDFSSLNLRPGQWVSTEAGQRGQFLGVTGSGATVIRWQQETRKFRKPDAMNNQNLRRFAKTYGSK